MYIVANRSFNSLSDAENYCLVNDFCKSIIVKENDNKMDAKRFEYWENREKEFAAKRDRMAEVKRLAEGYAEGLNNKSVYDVGLVYNRFEEDIEKYKGFYLFEDRGNFNIRHKFIELKEIGIEL